MNRVSVSDAASVLGVSRQAVRVMMQRKEIDIGYVVKAGRKKRYLIFSEKLRKVVG